MVEPYFFPCQISERTCFFSFCYVLISHVIILCHSIWAESSLVKFILNRTHIKERRTETAKDLTVIQGCLGAGGVSPYSSKKTVFKGALKGALKIGQVLVNV